MAAAALMIAGCSSGTGRLSTAGDSTTARSVAPSVTPSGGPATVSLAAVDRVGAQLVALGRHPAFLATARATADDESAGRLLSSAEDLLARMHALSSRGRASCPQLVTAARQATGLASKLQSKAKALGHEATALRQPVAAASQRTAQVQRSIGVLVAASRPATDSELTGRLRAYATSANALALTLRAADALIAKVFAQHARFTAPLTLLHSASTWAATTCSVGA